MHLLTEEYPKHADGHLAISGKRLVNICTELFPGSTSWHKPGNYDYHRHSDSDRQPTDDLLKMAVKHSLCDEHQACETMAPGSLPSEPFSRGHALNDRSIDFFESLCFLFFHETFIFFEEEKPRYWKGFSMPSQQQRHGDRDSAGPGGDDESYITAGFANGSGWVSEGYRPIESDATDPAQHYFIRGR